MNYILGRFKKWNRFDESARLKDIIKKNSSTRVGPSYVAIDITNRCNLNCIACWTFSPLLKDKKPSPEWYRKELKLEVIRDVINDLSKMGTERIRLSGGGEPFMHPDIMEISREIKMKGIKLEIVTNFTLLNESSIKELIEIGIDNLTVSLWAASPRIYMATHPNQKGETFDRIDANLLLLSKLKKSTKVVIANVISSKNCFETENMVEYAFRIGADEVYFTLVDPIKGATDSLLLSESQLRELRHAWQKINSNLDKGIYGKLKIDNPKNFMRRINNDGCINGDYDAQIGDIPCTAGYTFSRILANGDVSPCCKAVMIPSGNINESSFRDIWNGASQQRFRKIGLELSKHPFFMEKVGCRRSCDNHMENVEMENRINSYLSHQKDLGKSI